MLSGSIAGELHAVGVPTLVTKGAYDEAKDTVLQPFLDEIPDVKLVKFEHNAHIAHLEERERYISVLASFIE